MRPSAAAELSRPGGHWRPAARRSGGAPATAECPLTPPPDPTIGWYDRHAAALAGRYEALAADQVHAWLAGLLPATPVLVLDIGAGSGRDAAWLAAAGHQVLAVEPAAALRQHGQRLHPKAGIHWLDDRLPALPTTLLLGLAADVILLSGVWQHVAPADRPRAFRKLASLLKSGGLLALTLRLGPAEPGPAAHPVSLAEVEQLARAQGLVVVHVATAADLLGRPGVNWIQVALRLPDDGTGALPLLRHAILNDQKSATYKLGLLRALCRAADGAARLTEDSEGEHVAVPLGLVALNPSACAVCTSSSGWEAPSRKLKLDRAPSSAKAATAPRGSGAVWRAGRALEDDELGPLELCHELLSQQGGGHLPGGTAPRLAALVEPQAIGQGRGELRLVDRQQGVGQRGRGLGGGVKRFRCG